MAATAGAGQEVRLHINGGLQMREEVPDPINRVRISRIRTGFEAPIGDLHFSHHTASIEEIQAIHNINKEEWPSEPVTEIQLNFLYKRAVNTTLLKNPMITPHPCFL